MALRVMVLGKEYVSGSIAFTQWKAVNVNGNVVLRTRKSLHGFINELWNPILVTGLSQKAKQTNCKRLLRCQQEYSHVHKG